ncbi:YjcZ family sporulation protein [Robertmurraya andreesenii]
MFRYSTGGDRMSYQGGGYGGGMGFALIVVLFILLIIVGASYMGY